MTCPTEYIYRDGSIIGVVRPNTRWTSERRRGRGEEREAVEEWAKIRTGPLDKDELLDFLHARAIADIPPASLNKT